jgi:prepilin-type N-terminal cleavage/methylation domain-containing protein
MVGPASRPQSGFSLIESLVGVAVLAIVAVASYQAIMVAVSTVNLSRAKVAAAAIANEQVEIARNLAYGSLGTVSGWPAGVLPAVKNVVRDGKTFTVQTTVRNIDNAFDGVVGGTPNDTAPADYKLVEILVSCADCRNFSPLRFDTWVAPTSLESSSSNGSLFVRAFDALGVPLSGANVHVVNSDSTPAIDLTDVTDVNGSYQLIDVPPGVNKYQITVSKGGYSTERTYAAGGVAGSNPTRPHATVTTGALTQASFSIDRLGSLAVTSLDSACAAVAGVDFSLTGTKKIGATPVYKYAANLVTNGGGTVSLSDMEWDTYAPVVTDAAFDLLGTLPVTPLILNPGASENLTLIVGPKNPRRLLVTVKDATTKQPLTGASVRLTSTGGYDVTLATGRGYVSQSDWVGGSGQDDYANVAKYLSQNGTVKTSTAGQLSLAISSGSRYYTSGSLTSSTFDLGAPASFQQVIWAPTSQPTQVGTDGVRVQLAANNDNTTWDFVGPDGTAATYYTTANQAIWPGHNGSRYLRYKVFLQSANNRYTPTVSDLYLSFTTGCMPPGQVNFAGLASGTYTLTVSKSGYTTKTSSPAVSSSWQRADVELTP